MAPELKRGKYKWDEGGRKGCMFIKNRFKHLLSDRLFSTRFIKTATLKSSHYFAASGTILLVRVDLSFSLPNACAWTE